MSGALRVGRPSELGPWALSVAPSSRAPWQATQYRWQICDMWGRVCSLQQRRDPGPESFHSPRVRGGCGHGMGCDYGEQRWFLSLERLKVGHPQSPSRHRSFPLLQKLWLGSRPRPARGSSSLSGAPSPPSRGASAVLADDGPLRPDTAFLLLKSAAKNTWVLPLRLPPEPGSLSRASSQAGGCAHLPLDPALCRGGR